MDVSTLPDEMFANILKYTDFDKVRELRKINGKIDKLARKNNISTRISIENLELQENWILLVTAKSRLPTEKNLKTRYYKTGLDYAKCLDKWLSKVEVSGGIFIYRIEFDENMFNVFKKNQLSLRNLKSFSFTNVKFTLSNCMAKTLVQRICPNLSKFTLSDANGSGEKLCGVEVLGNRKWNSVYIFSPALPLGDDFILQIGPNCEKFVLKIKDATYTVRGVIEMLKKCLMAEEYNKEICIETVKLGNVPPADITHLLKTSLPANLKHHSSGINGQKHFMIYSHADPKKRLDCNIFVNVGENQ